MTRILERRVKTLEDLVAVTSLAELAFLDGVVAGTAAASKAVVLGASKNMPLDIVYNSIVRQSATLSATSGDTGTTLTNLAGLVQTVVPGTYKFKIDIGGVATANSGMKLAFKYTTAVLGSLEAIGKGFTATGVVAQHTTTATDQASLLASTTAFIAATIEGTMVVTTGGTVQLQGAQNASHVDTTSFYLGSTMEFKRIA